MAEKCFKLTEEQVSKEARFYAKNQFVFPLFYGSYWKKIAPNLWDIIDSVKTKDGKTLREHLTDCGLGDYSSFEMHISEMEYHFWNEMFPEYYKWRKDWWESYLRKGYFDLLSGFRQWGVFSRNDVINYPIQGSAFHCLLWSLIRLVKWCRKYLKGRGGIVGQIHDSILADVPLEYKDLYIEKAIEIMTKEIVKKWKWIIVPLDVEVEVSESNWFEKKPIEFGKGG